MKINKKRDAKRLFFLQFTKISYNLNENNYICINSYVLSEKNKKSKIKNKIKEEILESIISQDEEQIKGKKDKKKKTEKTEEKTEEKIDGNLNDRSDETNTVENENKQKPTLSFT